MKICDFGSGNPLYARDYYEVVPGGGGDAGGDGDGGGEGGGVGLLIPLRWMSWEAAISVRRVVHLIRMTVSN